MKEYPKIQTVFKRDPDNNYKTLLLDEYAKPEFAHLKDTIWEFTEKVDGTNIRVIITRYEDDNIGVKFKGKTDKANIPPFLIDRLNELFDSVTLETNSVITRLEFGENITLYGEGYGAKIQKGGGNYIPDGVDFVLFDVKIGDYWLERKNIKDIAETLHIGIVRICGGGTIDTAVELVKEGFNSQWGDFTAEGLVARPLVQLFNRQGERIIWKLKYKDFNR